MLEKDWYPLLPTLQIRMEDTWKAIKSNLQGFVRVSDPRQYMFTHFYVTQN